MAGILSIQFTPKSGDKEHNLKKVEEMISGYCDKQLDLVVMPEFFSTGIRDESFVNEPEDENGGMVTKFLSEIAKKFHTNIVCGSVIERSEGKLYNTSFVINREGNIVGKYRKIHLYNFFGGNEGAYTNAGNSPLVVELDFAKVGVSLCFDIKFPMLYKELIRQGAEIIVSPSAWCILASAENTEREIFTKTWEAMNICRATESLIYFVTSNLVGKTPPFLNCIGHSMITGPFGEVLQNAKDSEECIYADVDLNKVRELKSSVPVASID